MFKRFTKFGVFGGSGVLVDMAVLYVLCGPHLLSWNLSIGKAIAAEIAIVNNFVWNGLWTFRDAAIRQSSVRARAERLGRFNLICLAGIAISILLLNAQVHYFLINTYVANLVAIAGASLWNLFMNFKFGWAAPRNIPEPEIRHY